MLYCVHRGHWPLSDTNLLKFGAILLRDLMLTLEGSVDEVFPIVYDKPSRAGIKKAAHRIVGGWSLSRWFILQRHKSGDRDYSWRSQVRLFYLLWCSDREIYKNILVYSIKHRAHIQSCGDRLTLEELDIARRISVSSVCREFFRDFIKQSPFYGSIQYSVEVHWLSRISFLQSYWFLTYPLAWIWIPAPLVHQSPMRSYLRRKQNTLVFFSLGDHTVALRCQRVYLDSSMAILMTLHRT